MAISTARLNMPTNGSQTTLDECLKKLGDQIKYIGLIDDSGNVIQSIPIKSDGTGAISPFQDPSNGSMSVGDSVAFYIEGTSTNPIVISMINLTNMSEDQNGVDPDFAVYDVSVIDGLTEAERTFNELGTFVVDDIIIELTINQNV